MWIEGDIGRMIEGEAKEEVLLDGIVEVSSIKFQIYIYWKISRYARVCLWAIFTGEYSSCLAMHLSKAEELHVVRTPDRDSVANVLSVDTLDRSAVGSLGVAALGSVGLGALGLVVVVAKDAGPLLHGLLVVSRTQGSVSAAVVDLHLGASAGEARVH